MGVPSSFLVGDGSWLGRLYDGDAETPETTVLLERDGHHVSLRMPIDDLATNPYARWVTQGWGFGDDPDKTKFRYEPPETLWFDGAKGRAALTGCYSLGLSGNLIGASEGRVAVSLAVIGARGGEDYARINGMQSVIPGLSLWMADASMTRDQEYDEDQRLKRLSVTWARQRPTRMSRQLNLSANRGFQYSDVVPTDQAMLEDQWYLQTLVTRSRPWREHHELHEAVADLVSLAAWAPFSPSGLDVSLDSDPLRTMDGTSHGKQWLQAHCADWPPDQDHGSAPRFWFHWPDIGSAGIHRWLSLRREFRRGVQPLVFTLRKRRVPLEGIVQQLGAAVEAIGFQLLVDDGLSKTELRRTAMRDKAARVVLDLPSTLHQPLQGWADHFRDVYTAVKHPDNPLPTGREQLVAMRHARLVLRAWIGCRIGVSNAVLHRAVRVDSDASDINF